MADLSRLVADALAAIDDDAPDFARPLRALAEDAPLCGALAREPARAGRLFAELRKLRPIGLWVRGGAEVLAVKRDLVLDGAVVRLPTGAEVPPAEGRECWIEAPSSEAPALLRSLPAGYGLVCVGLLGASTLRALGPWARMRALGVVVAAGAILPSGRARDLVIEEHRGPTPAAHPEREPRTGRTLWSGVRPVDALAAGHSPSLGLVCGVGDAVAWALSLACLRPGRPKRL